MDDSIFAVGGIFLLNVLVFFCSKENVVECWHMFWNVAAFLGPVDELPFDELPQPVK